MKKITIIIAALVSCFTLGYADMAEGLIDEIKDEKPFVCEILLITLDASVEEKGTHILDSIPNAWHMESPSLQLSIDYIDRNKIVMPGMGTFALKNTYGSKNTMLLQIHILADAGKLYFTKYSGKMVVEIGKWVLLDTFSFGPTPETDRTVVAIRFW